MGQNNSILDSSDEADTEKKQKKLQYQSKISAMEAAGEIDNLPFSDFLARLEDLEKLQYFIPESAAKDHIKTLKRELKFLKTFSKCIARNEDLKDSSASVISAIKRASWGLFSRCPAPGEVSIPMEAMSVLSDALREIKEDRQEIVYFYEQVSVSSDSHIHMTSDLLMEFINDLLQNLKDLLRCKAALVVSFKSQIVALKEELHFHQNFLDFARNRCSDEESLKDLITHSEHLAIGLAQLSYSLLADKMNEEPSVETNLKLSDMLQKMKPTKPEVREVYIRVLKASNRDGHTIYKHVLEGFLDYIQHYLLELLNSRFRFKHSVQDRLKILDQKLRFLRILLMDPPTNYLDKRTIDAVITASGLLIFSLNANEMTEENASQINAMLVDLLETMSCVERLAKEIYLKVSKSPRSKFPKTNGLGFIQSFVENLEDLLYHGHASLAFPEHQIGTIKKDFESITSDLKHTEKKLNQNEELKSLWTRVIDLVYQTQYVIDSFLAKDGPAWYYILWLSDIMEEVQIVKTEVIKFNTKMADDRRTNDAQKPSNYAVSSQACATAINVGFEDEEKKLLEMLKGGPSQLDIISIVGMAGLGKTTLSKRIFNSPLLGKYFHVRGWCSVSETYRKKDILHSLLSQVSEQQEGEDKVDNDILDQVLYQRLKGKKYFIVLDDIWKTEAWLDLRISFPDDENGSRIMFTTRNLDVATAVKLHTSPHSLRPFHDDESWRLLQQMLFQEESCPTMLEEIGKQIAKSCKGIPLSVALVAGILQTDNTEDLWNKVSQNLASSILDSPEGQTKEIIEMSYKHLPYHLRPCFLYLGAFLEDQEIAAKRLIWLWTAEGFVRKPENGSIEETAEDYLNILICRSLLSISKRKADGGIKKCHVHDLLLHFCKVKSREENFWQFDGFVSTSGAPTYDQHRLCMYYQGDAFIRSRPSGSHVRSLLLHNPEYNAFFSDRAFFSDISCISNNFKLLRVLDLENLDVHVFPDGLEMLILLKYLGLRIDNADFVPASVLRLWNLETFVLKVIQNVIMPETIWKLRKLRHLHVRHGMVFDSDYQRRSEFFSEPDLLTKLFADPNSRQGLDGQRQPCSEEEDSDQQMLEDLETISNLCLFQGEEEKELRKIPNIQKLRCSLKDSYDSSNNGNHFPSFELLRKLESLHVSNSRNSRLLHSNKAISFPSKLKKLTLSTFQLSSEKISMIGRLENLEVLKLQVVEIEDRHWEMIDGEFPSLKHLELKNVGIKEWDASADNFPCLKRLRLLSVYELKEVPYCFGSVQTLEMIEVNNCYSLDLESVWEIQQDQVDNGNDEFKVTVS